MTFKTLCSRLMRKKVYKDGELEDSGLLRCLNRWDAAALGAGVSIGVGVTLATGAASLGIVNAMLCLLVAAVAYLCSAVCFGELTSRFPRTGVTYVYINSALGEFSAFIIGWIGILDFLIGAASIAKGLSLLLDSLSEQAMSNWFTSFAPLPTAYLSEYFDFTAFFIVILIGGFMTYSTKKTAALNNILIALYLVIIVFAIVLGAFNADITNWRITETQIPITVDTSWDAILRSTAYAYCAALAAANVASSAGEVKKAKEVLPATILYLILVSFLAYAGLILVMTLMIPYYLLETVGSIGSAFSQLGWNWAMWCVSIGTLFGLISGIISMLYTLTRLLYAMSSDRMLPSCFMLVSKSRNSPYAATIIGGCIIALLSGLMSLEQLLLTVCVGTLISYTAVAICVLIFRYSPEQNFDEPKSLLKRIFPIGKYRIASNSSKRVTFILLVIFICSCLVIGLTWSFTTNQHNILVPVIILHVIALLLVCLIALQPQNSKKIYFKTPLVPLVPCVSIYVNIFLMTLINVQTWIRLAIWILLGIPVYLLCVCCYNRNKNKDKFVNENRQAPVHIIVESPTPPSSKKPKEELVTNDVVHYKNNGYLQDKIYNEITMESIEIQHAVEEVIGEKEENAINILDQVIQAEEDNYCEEIAMEEINDNLKHIDSNQSIPYRNSLSELSDAGSDASMGIHFLSKYDVIAQVHREDLCKVYEEEEKPDNNLIIEIMNYEQEPIREEDTISNEKDLEDSETNSRTDESGYSDTLDRTVLNDSIENISNKEDDKPYIPVPPPMDEFYFANDGFKKSYTIQIVPKSKNIEPDDDQRRPRTSVLSRTSNISQDDGAMVFGSDKQMNFMSKLDTIFKTKITTSSPKEGDGEVRRRSRSTGNVTENTMLSLNRQQSQPSTNLNNEIIYKRVLPLPQTNLKTIDDLPINQLQDEEDSSLSRTELKSKLENIFAAGGPKPNPKLTKDQPIASVDSRQMEISTTENKPKLPKTEKNDTLGRQKAKFSAVLNSLININKEDVV